MSEIPDPAKKLPSDPPGLPREAGKNERPDISISGRRSPAAPLLGVPPFPTFFIERPEAFPELKARLLASGAGAGDDGSAVLLHGPGGVGKTILAAALAHDPEVRERFPDGIFWATLDRHPEILPLLGTWIAALGDRDYKPTTLDAARDSLRRRLREKSALLIVDDAWQAERAQWFQVGGPECRMIVTSRRADLAESLGTSLLHVETFTPDQSLQLFSARLGREIGGDERGLALALAKAVGHLPLALELVAARVSGGASWTGLDRALQDEAARLDALDLPKDRDGGVTLRDRAAGETALEATFGVSLSALREEREEAWRAFIELGVLPNDAWIAAPMASTLWEVETAEAEALLEALRNHALVMSGLSRWIGGKKWRGYRLHDLLHDIARRRLVAATPQGLGSSMTESHTGFLERYARRLPGGAIDRVEWHRLEDDGYIHEHLVWHLEQSDRLEEMEKLLGEETESGKNGWYAARDRLGQSSGYLNDLFLAWRLADRRVKRQLEAGQPLHAIGFMFRLALIRSSLYDREEKIPADLYALLMSRGLWTPIQALSHAGNGYIPAIVPYLPQSLLPEALEKVRTTSLSFDGSLGETLSKIAPDLPEPLLWRALEITRAISDGSARASALTELAPHLPEPLPSILLREALDAARTIASEEDRGWALARIVPSLPETLVREALELSPSFLDENDRDPVLLEVARWLAFQGEFEEAFEIARRVTLDHYRVSVLIEVAIQLSEPLRTAALSEILDSAISISHENARGRVLGDLSPYLPGLLLPKALHAAREMADEEDASQALAGIAARFAALGDAEHALDLVREPMMAFCRVRALTKMAPHLPEHLLPRALDAARAIEYECPRAEALMGIAPHLPEDLRSAVFREALDTARAETFSDSRSWTLSDLASAFARRGDFDRALAAAREVGSHDLRARALSTIASRLPEADQIPVIQEALEAAQAIGDDLVRDRARSEITHWLSSREDESSFVSDREREEDPRRPDPGKAALQLPRPIRKTLENARAISDDRDRAEALLRIASRLPESLRGVLIQEALDAARKTPSEYCRALLLLKIAPQLAAQGRWGPALEILREVEIGIDAYLRGPALATMESYLLREPLPQAGRYWLEILWDWSFLSRFWRLDQMRKVLPLLDRLGGESVLREVQQSIEAVGRWWP